MQESTCMAFFKKQAEPATCSTRFPRQSKEAADASTNAILPPQQLQRPQEGHVNRRTGLHFSDNTRSEGQIQRLAALFQDTAHIWALAFRMERPETVKKRVSIVPTTTTRTVNNCCVKFTEPLPFPTFSAQRSSPTESQSWQES